jgi:DNA polymerase III gamma/tau subunit
MRDSQSLLEQLLAVSRERITADDVNRLLGIAAAERLSGLVRYLVARDAAAALAELDATIAEGVDVGLLLDQLVGYLRDVMTSAVGCGPDQMLYALPSQAGEVADIGRQLGLQTILAIGQILDHTAARMRISMHGRTLVEMAIVRICNLGDLDELASLVAELRGQGGEQPARGPARPTEPAKKNIEPPTASLADALAKHEKGRESDAPARLTSASRSPRRRPRNSASIHRTLPTSHPRRKTDRRPLFHPQRKNPSWRNGNAQSPTGHRRRRPICHRVHHAASSKRRSPNSRSSAARWSCSTSRPANFATRRRKAMRIENEFISPRRRGGHGEDR